MTGKVVVEVGSEGRGGLSELKSLFLKNKSIFISIHNYQSTSSYPCIAVITMGSSEKARG